MQRVNAPAGQMQLKGLIEAYVVSLVHSLKVLCQDWPLPMFL